MKNPLIALTIVAVVVMGCNKKPATAINPVAPSVVVPTTPAPIPETWVGAGDIGQCQSATEATGRLLDTIPGTIFTAGDNSNTSGSTEAYLNCYEPFWGRQMGRTWASPGNHDYLGQPSAAPYFAYFGTRAGPAGLGYYSYDLGDWHILSLNSVANIPAQTSWLQQDLQVNQKKCIAAVWHYPLFTGDKDNPGKAMLNTWQILYQYGATIVVNGHNHWYDRFAPMTPGGVVDTAKGIRQFIVGTGGAAPDPRGSQRGPNSENFLPTGTYGVIKFTLKTGGYDWQFIPVAGSGSDSGSGTCH